VFDSGVGGLTVVAALQRRLPHEDLLYLGDTARLPYGTKSPDTVRRYARGAARVLVERGVKMLVIACNTASAIALDDLVEEFAPLPTIGVVGPGAVAAVRATRSGRILVLGTESTVRGGAYPRAISAEHARLGAVLQASGIRLPVDLDVRGQACPLFVSLAEEGWVEGDVPEAVARRYLEPHLRPSGAPSGDERPHADDVTGHGSRMAHEDASFDTLVLGCTHFPMLTSALRRVVGPRVEIVDSARTTADVVAEALRELDLLVDASTRSREESGRATDVEGCRRNPVALTRLPLTPGSERHVAGDEGLAFPSEAATSIHEPAEPAEHATRRPGRLALMATDATERFARVGSVFLGHELRAQDVTLVDLC